MQRSGRHGSIALETLESRLLLDAGAIHGTKFEDLDADGVFDVGEPALPGVPIVLTWTDAGGQPQSATTTTMANGEYWFEALDEDIEYTVTEVPLPGTTQTTADPAPILLQSGIEWVATQQQKDALVSGGSLPANVMIAPLLRFGNAFDGSIHGTKFEDTNDNGEQDGVEPFLPNIEINLSWTDGAGQPQTATTTTGANGQFHFENLAAGPVYTVTETAPLGTSQTTDPPIPITIGSGEEYVVSTAQRDQLLRTVAMLVEWDVDVVPTGQSQPVTISAAGTAHVRFGAPVGLFFGGTFPLFDANGDPLPVPAGQLYQIPIELVSLDLVGADPFSDGVVHLRKRAITTPIGSIIVQNGGGTLTGSSSFTAFLEFEFSDSGDVIRSANATGVSKSFTVGDGIPGVDVTWMPAFSAQTGLSQAFTNNGAAWGTLTAAATNPLRNTTYKRYVVQDDLTFGNHPELPGSIHGLKFEDLNANGVMDAGEPALEGVEVVASWLDRTGAPQSLSTTTIGNGEYWFEDLVSGVEYTITEVAPPSSTQMTPDPAAILLEPEIEWVATQEQKDALVLAGVAEANVMIEPLLAFGNAFNGAIHGLKFNDINRDGDQDAGEEGVSGIEIVLAWTDSLGQEQSTTTTTMAGGEYWFESLTPGLTYSVTEIRPDGTVQTTPDPAPIFIESGIAWVATQEQKDDLVTGGHDPALVEIDSGLAIGNKVELPGAIHGLKYEDIDVDGVRDPGEPPLAGVTIVASWTNNAGQPQTRTTTTMADGSYWFDNLASETEYTITELAGGTTQISADPPAIYLLPGTAWVATAEQAAELELGGQDPALIETEPLLAFGNAYDGSIHGYKFEDSDADGVWDEGEPAIEGVEIVLNWIDAGGSAQSSTTATDVNGEYWFTQLTPGLEYLVTENAPSHTQQTTADPQPILIGSGREWVATAEQGDRLLQTVKFPWTWEIELDPVPLGGPIETMQVTGMAKILFARGTGRTTGHIADLIDVATGLPAELPQGEDFEVPIELVSMNLVGTDPVSGNPVTVRGSGNGLGVLRNQGGVLIGGFGGTYAVDSFFDITYEIEIDNGGGDTMILAPAGPIDLGMDFVAGDAIAPTDLAWMPTILWKTGLAQDLLDDVGTLWDQVVTIHTTPNAEVAEPLRIVEDPNLAFGNTFLGSIHGYKFEDLDVNGVDDAEPRLAGVTINLSGTDVTGGVVNETTTTMANGEYWFMDLLPGSYTVTEVPPSGSFATTETSYLVTLESRQELVAEAGQAGINPEDPNDPRVEIVVGPDLVFGNAFEGSIHGFKFEDVNGNGVRDAGDSALSGIEIVLDWQDASGTARSAAMVTDVNGEYWFEWLEPGLTYTVSETAPAGSVQTTPDPAPIFIGSGQEYVATAAQGAAVQHLISFPWMWEIELDPVPLGGPTETIQVQGMAKFAFSDLVGQSNGQIVSPVDPATGLANAVPQGQDFQVDIELIQMELTGSTPTLGGVTVRGTGQGQGTVRNDGGVLIGGFGGDFNVDSFFDITYEIEFDNGGPPMIVAPAAPIDLGMDFIAEDAIAPTDVRWMPTILWQTGLAQNLLDDAGTLWDQVITIHAEPQVEVEKPIRTIVDPDLSFGNTFLGSIHGYKFEDINVNGVDDSEPGLQGVVIQLTGTDGKSMPVNLSTVTDANGEYWFMGLQPGNYTVTEVVPFGSLATRPTSSGTLSLESREELVAVAGQADIPEGDPRVEVLIGAPLIFGNAIEGSIHGFKFEDTDRDGVWDEGEPAVEGVTIRLTWNDGGAQLLTTTTDANGEFWFDRLEPGLTYTAREVEPEGHIRTTVNPSPILVQSGEEYVATLTQGDDVQHRLLIPWQWEIEVDPVPLGGPTETLVLTGTAEFAYTDPVDTTTGEAFPLVDPTTGLPNVLPQGQQWLVDIELVEMQLTGTDPVSGGVATLRGTGVGTGIIQNAGGVLTGGFEEGFHVDSFFDITYEIELDPPTGPTIVVAPNAPLSAGTTFNLGNGLDSTNVRWLPAIFSETGLAKNLRNQAGQIWGQVKSIQAEPSGTFNPPVRTLVIPELVFGNRPLDGSIHGLKFDDLNVNGFLDAGEPRLEGITIQLNWTDANGQAQSDTTTTMANGEYWFEDLTPRLIYTVTEVAPAGSLQITRNPPPILINPGVEWVATQAQADALIAGGHPASRVRIDRFLAFGNAFEGSIHGTKFEDLDKDGVHDAGEIGLEDVEIVLSWTDAEGVARSLTTTTMAGGEYWFEDLEPGLTYSVTEVAPLGTTQTTANPAPLFIGSGIEYVATQEQKDDLVALGVPAGRIVIHADLAFGNFPEPRGSIHGIKYEDVNANGLRDPGEPGLPDVEFALTFDIDGVLQTLVTTSMAGGEFWFEDLIPFLTYTLTETVPEGSIQTAGNPGPILIEPGVEHVATQAQATALIQNEGHDPALIEINAQLLFGNAYLGSIHGTKFEDLDGEGDQDPEDGPLENVEIILTWIGDGGQTQTESAFTMANGEYWFEDLEPGITYTVTEHASAGTVQTTTNPAPIFLASGIEHVATQEQADALILLGLDPSRIVINPLLTFGNHPVPPGSIHGLKFDDLNANGVLDEGEPGIEGVTITLAWTDDFGVPQTQTTTTMAGGEYWFEEILAGVEYTVTETAPDGSTQTTDDPAPILIAPGVEWVATAEQAQHLVDNGQNIELIEIDPLLAFGNAFDGSIHGLKFEDVDGDGVQDAGEDGLEGVEIVLSWTDSDGVFQTVSTLTMAGGEYWFEDLQAGLSYSVTEIAPLGTVQSTADPAPIFVESGVEYVATQAQADALEAAGHDPARIVINPLLAFGNLPLETGSIHGLKFEDINADGVFDEGAEPGLTGITITLSWTDLAGETQTSTTTTMAGGEYWFEDLLPNVLYTVTEEAPDGSTQTTTDPNPIFIEPGVEWVATQAQFDALETGGHNPELIVIDPLLAFGNAFDGSIHGVKFEDLDGDGVQDAGELGLEGVEIVITWTDDQGQPQTQSALTMAGGEYWFEDLTPGFTYTIMEIAPQGTTQTTADPAPILLESGFEWVATAQQEADLIAAGIDPGKIVIAGELKFGNRPDVPGSIHGLKFEDVNANGQLDEGEPAIEGVTITLSWIDLAGETQMLSTTTMAGGEYWFEDLLTGVEYTVTEEAPAGTTQTTAAPAPILLAPGVEWVATAAQAQDLIDGGHNEELIVVDPQLAFGNAFNGSIHGIKFEDADGNGLFDAGEEGLAGVEIVLSWTDAAGPQSTSTLSMANGEFWFENLAAGFIYALTETVPGGFVQTTPDPPAIFVESGIEYVATEDQALTLIEGGHDPALVVVNPLLVFGNLPVAPGSIHGLKFEDLNANGVFDEGEPGLPGVIVFITWTNASGQTEIDTTRTMDDGQYWFEDLLSNVEYTVREIAPPGSVRTTVNPAPIFVAPGVEWVATAEQASALIAGGHAEELIEIEPLLAFGNAFLGSIHGVKFEDLDGDGMQSAGEQGLADVEIELRRVGTSNPIATTLTMANGEFWFENLTPGSTYTLTEVPPDNTTQTTPNPTPIVLGSGEEYVATIVQRDALLRDVAMYVEWELDVIPEGETEAVTITASGTMTVRFGDPVGLGNGATFPLHNAAGNPLPVPAGQQYLIPTEIVSINLSGLNPSGPGLVNISLRPETTSEGELLVQNQGGVLVGDSFFDVFFDIEFTAASLTVGAAGATPIGMTFTAADAIDVGDVLWMPAITWQDGLGQNLLDESGTVREELAALHTRPLVDTPIKRYIVQEDLIFGNQSELLGSIHGLKFEDLDVDGVHDPGEPPIPGVPIILTWTAGNGQTQSLTTTTMDDGQYWFEDVAPGFTYTVTELAPNGSMQTTADPATIALLPGFEWVANQTQADELIAQGIAEDRIRFRPQLAFGNAFEGSIHGIKFADINGNGIQDPGDDPIENVEIVLTWDDANGIEQTDSTLTMANGEYWFVNLTPGLTYSLSEVEPAQTTQTTPDPAPITILSGEEYVATAAQRDALLQTLDLLIEWELEIVPVGEIDPVSLVVAGPAQIRFGAPVGQTTAGTFALFDANGDPQPVPPGEDYQIPIEIVSLDLVGFDPTGLGEVRVRLRDGFAADGQLTVGNQSGLLVGDSFFDVFFDIEFVNEEMTIGSDNATHIGMTFAPGDAIPANDVLWMPALTWQTGLAQLLLDDAGSLWDTLVTLHTRPLRETPIKRYIVQGDLAFGNQPDLPGSIHGLKFEDLNVNGVFDEGESGIPGITIVLSWTDLGGTAQSDSTVTMTNGEYWFEDLDPRIEYFVSEQAPDGSTQTTDNPPAILLGPAGIEWVATEQQKQDLVDGGHDPLLVEIEPLLAFGNAYDGSIHGYKFSDLDSDGLWDEGEPGIEGVEIVLTWTDAAEQVQTSSTFTMADGEFWFEDLTAGFTYALTEIAPFNTLQSTPDPLPIFVESGIEYVATQEQADALILGGLPAARVVVDPTLIFGNRPDVPGSIHGYKFEDLNVNGVDDDEPRLEGVTITLTGDVDRDGNIDTVVMATDPNGEYWFENLRPGDYTITETPPVGSINTTPLSYDVTVHSGQELVALEGQANITDPEDPRVEVVIGPILVFGNAFEGSIHGVKFDDANGNGVWDEGEGTLTGVEINLDWTDAEGVEQSLSTTTMAGGEYWFEDLTPGLTYTVTETVPDRSLQRTLDPPPITILSGIEWVATPDQAAALELGGHDPTRIVIEPLLAFGNELEPSGSIHGLKFEDLNANGILDVGEPGLPGVTIVLSWMNALDEPESQTTTTMENGEYWFENLVPLIEYTVTETTPLGSTQMTPDPAPILLGLDVEWVATQAQANALIAAGHDASRVEIDPLLAFGNAFDGSIHGVKYEDLNGDGAQNVGEPTIPGVQINLTWNDGAGQAQSLSTTTMANGEYWFEDLEAGLVYTVREVSPAGMTQSSVNPAPILLPSGIEFVANAQQAADLIAAGLEPARVLVAPLLAFGNYRPVSYHGQKFEDLNGNGVKDAGEPGVDGVTIRLFGANGAGQNVNLTTTTSGGGLYWFMEVRPGSYRLSETVPSGWVASTPTTVGPFTLASGQTLEDVDFGNFVRGSIHGHKFEDVNVNGIDDAELRLEGVRIVLTGQTGAGANVNRTVFTDANGDYWFLNVNPGNYTVTETPPAGSVNTTPISYEVIVQSREELVALAGQAGLDPEDPNELRTEVVVGPALAFGNAFDGSIHGYKFEDEDGNGVWDEGELPIEGVEIVLTWTDSAGTEQTLSTTTMADGEYWFEDLEAALTYTVREVAPSGSFQTTENPEPILLFSDFEWVADQDQADALILAGLDPSRVMIDARLAFGNQFGVPGSIHGLKFDDLNVNGEFDAGEPGVEGVVITISWTDDAGLPQTRTTTTMGDGQYWFENVASGFDYTVTETAPDGSTQTTQNPAAISLADGVEWVATEQQAIELVNGGHDPELIVIDPLLAFGNAFDGSIHGLKYDDLDGDGVLDAGEPVIEGVTILLTWTDGAGQSQSDSTTTMENGEYWFEDLEPGVSYTVREVAPDGMTQTSTDPDPILVLSGVEWVATQAQATALEAGGHDPDRIEINPLLAFGNAFDGSIHGLKFEDLDADGVFDEGEPTIEGVTIVLTWTDAAGQSQSDSTTTMENGEYWFEDLAAGFSYSVREVAPDGSTQTTANPAPILVLSGVEYVATQQQADALGAGGHDPGLIVVKPLLAFGNALDGSIHGLKFEDIDANGEMDEGDEGIEGVTIVLSWTDAAGQSQSTSTTTMANGEYWFEEIAAGFAYTVREVAPGGSAQTTPDPAPIFLESGIEWVATQEQADALVAAGLDQSLIRIEPRLAFGNQFGEPGSIHGLKFEDLDADGQFDPGEPPIEGVTIVLTWTDDNGQQQTRTTTTMANGQYWFESVAAGREYTVTETAPDGSTQTTENPAPIFIVEGVEWVATQQQATDLENNGHDPLLIEIDPLLAFGNALDGSIHGLKYNDLNANGELDEGEPGIEGVTIVLTWQDASGVEQTFSTTTMAGGEYWIEDLEAGLTYTVREEAPDGSTQTSANPAPIFVASGIEHVATQAQADALEAAGLDASRIVINPLLAFGNSFSGSIHGLKFEDLDADGVHDASEPGLPDVTINLTWEDAAGQLQTLSTMTMANGEYWFEDLVTGVTYTVREVAPEGSVQTTTNPAAIDLAAGIEWVANQAQADALIAAGLDEANIRFDAALAFGNTFEGSIHGFKYEDRNGDGDYDPGVDAPLAGVTFTLTGTDGLGNVVNLPTTSGADGGFDFTGLLPSVAGQGAGTGYTVTETVPTGYFATTSTSYSSDLQSRQELVAFADQAELEPGDPQVEVLIGAPLRFGNTVLGSIHGLTFEDVNTNGVYDSLIDNLLPNVPVTLTGVNGQGTVVNNTKTSDDNGEFAYTGLIPSVAGNETATGYTVTVTPLTGHTPSTSTTFISNLLSRQELVAYTGQAALEAGDPRVESLVGAPLRFGFIIVPLEPVVTGTAVGAPGGAALAWVPSPAYPTTRVVRNDTGYPTDENDGTTVYEGTDKDFVDAVAPGTYYYAFFASDDQGGYSDPTDAGAEGTVVAADGLASLLDSSSERGIGMLAFTDSDSDGTIRAAEAGGALAVVVFGSATNSENDHLTATLSSPISGLFTLETQITTPALLNQTWNLQLTLGDGGTAAIDLAFRHRYLFARSDGGPLLQVARLLNPSTTYKLSIIIDTDAGTAEFYWDENKSLELSTTLGSLSQIGLLNMGQAALDLQYRLDDLSIVSGAPAFRIDGPFTAGVTADELNADVLFPGGSDRTFSSVALIDADEDGGIEGAIAAGQLALNLDGSSQPFENDAILATLDSSISGLFTFETEFTTPPLVNQDWSLQIDLEDITGNEIRMAFRGRYLFLRDGARWTQIKNLIDANTTYKLSVVVDTTAGTASYYIDNELTARVNVPTALSALSQIRFTNLGDATADLQYRFDNVRVVTGDLFSPPTIVADLALLSLLGPSESGKTDNSSQPRMDRDGERVAALDGKLPVHSMAQGLSDGQLANPDVRSDGDDAQGNEAEYFELADEIFATLGNGLN